MRVRLVPPLATLLLLAVAAAEPEPACASTSHPELATPADVQPQYYVDVDPCQVFFEDCFDNVWVYQEANGLDGLQRDDHVHSDVEACRDAGTPIAGDQLVY